jgi:DNA uptake protein ComE-like DNA-binding protein
MTFYSRHQVLLVLLLAGAAGAGLAIDQWRRARPDLVERLEALDREHAAPAIAWQRPPRPATASPPPPLDVNRATATELADLPGIGPALAARIVAARPFADVGELRRVRGLRRGTLERLRAHLTTGAAGAGRLAVVAAPGDLRPVHAE